MTTATTAEAASPAKRAAAEHRFYLALAELLQATAELIIVRITTPKEGS